MRNIKNTLFQDILGDALTITGQTDLTIDTCQFITIGGICIHLVKCKNIIIENCTFNDIGSGIYCQDCENVHVSNCYTTTINGPKPRGQFIQLNKCFGNSVIEKNIVNCYNSGHPEDLINLYKTSNVVVQNNYLKGGGDLDTGSDSGSGCMVGNNGGSLIRVLNNIVMSTGNGGIGVGGGSHIFITGNQVYSKQSPKSNVGIYILSTSANPTNNVVVTGNKVGWINSKGKSNGYYQAPSAQNIVLQNNNFNEPYTDLQPLPGWGPSYTLSDIPDFFSMMKSGEQVSRWTGVLPSTHSGVLEYKTDS